MCHYVVRPLDIDISPPLTHAPQDGKKNSKAPKIQRLVTPQVLQRKRARLAFKRDRRLKVHPSCLRFVRSDVSTNKSACDESRFFGVFPKCSSALRGGGGLKSVEDACARMSYR